MRVSVRLVTMGLLQGLPKTPAADPAVHGSGSLDGTASSTGKGRGVGCVALLCVLGLAGPAQAQFTREITLTVNAGQVVGGPHADFPMLVDVTDAELQCTPAGAGCGGAPGAVRSVDGYDIVFRGEADSPGICAPAAEPCMLAHEIELYDGLNGRVVAWVRIPSLTGTPTIHMYYGNAAITSPTASPGAVFDADYVGVWHLGETGSGSQYEYRDSSAYGNHGWGGQGDTLAAPSRSRQGRSASHRSSTTGGGTYEFIDVGQDATLNITGDEITMQAWVFHNIAINASHGVTGPQTTNVPYGILNHKGSDYGGYSLWLRGNTFDCPRSDPIPEPCVSSNIPGARLLAPDPHVATEPASPPARGTTSWRPTTAPTCTTIVEGVLSPGSLARTGNLALRWPSSTCGSGTATSSRTGGGAPSSRVTSTRCASRASLAPSTGSDGVQQPEHADGGLLHHRRTGSRLALPQHPDRQLPFDRRHDPLLGRQRDLHRDHRVGCGLGPRRRLAERQPRPGRPRLRSTGRTTRSSPSTPRRASG